MILVSLTSFPAHHTMENLAHTVEIQREMIAAKEQRNMEMRQGHQAERAALLARIAGLQDGAAKDRQIDAMRTEIQTLKDANAALKAERNLMLLHPERTTPEGFHIITLDPGDPKMVANEGDTVQYLYRKVGVDKCSKPG